MGSALLNARRKQTRPDSRRRLSVINGIGDFLFGQKRAAIRRRPNVRDAPITATPDRVRPEARIGVNLGLTRDRTAIVASQVAPDGKLEVLHVEILQGTRTNPVSLIGVEQRTLHLAHTLGTTRIEVDRWMSAQMAEGLCRRGLWVTPVTCDAAWLDPAATNLKRWFAQRHIRIPAHPGLIEELEGLEAKELRRRDRVRFTATGARYQDNAWLRNRRFAGWAPQLIANALGVSLVTLGQVER